MTSQKQSPQYFDPSTVASLPGGLTLSRRKIEAFRRDLSFWRRLIQPYTKPVGYLSELVSCACACPAYVVAVSPQLIVSVYSDDIDCVVLLAFPNRYTAQHHLACGTRLLSINAYFRTPDDERSHRATAADLTAGPRYTGWYNFDPVIAEFVSDDVELIATRKGQLDEDIWQRLEFLSQKYIERGAIQVRNGNPFLSHVPSVP